MYRHSMFGRIAKRTGHATGHPYAFMLALLLVVAWAATGPIFGFSDTWQLVINTSTTIATFLMVFLLQNTQNRDSAAVQLKLDELIRAVQGAHNAMLDLEELDQEDLEKIRSNYERLACSAREGIRNGQRDTGSPDVARMEENASADSEPTSTPPPAAPGRTR
jgi:low affinity Fe/Cu permease